MRLTPARLLAAVALTVIALVPFDVSANAMPTRALPGEAGLVVPARTADARIERETLEFDFTQDIEVASVQATYYLANTAAAGLPLDLVFVAPGGEIPTASLDGVPLTVVEVEAEVPVQWTASNLVLDPRTGDEYALGEYVREAYTRSWAFHVDLPAAAPSVLRVSYRAKTGYDQDRGEYIVRHTAYSLGPARNWAGLDILEVSAMVPAEYVLASSPALSLAAEDGEVAEYRGTFTGIPADLLRISTVRTPHPFASWLNPVLYGVPTAAGLLLALLIGTLAARLRGKGKAFLVGGTATLIASFVLLPSLAMLLSSVEPLASAGADLTANSGYMGTLALVFWLAIVAPFALSLLAAAVAAFRSSRRESDLARAAGI